MRITPACAGKSSISMRVAQSCRDHPRVCGEKNAPIQTYVDDAGSPPRVRGKAILRLTYTRAVGITPACAGKSYLCRYRRKTQ